MAKSNLNNIDLWELVRQGDRTAFDSLYHQYVSQLFALVYKHIPRQADAEDIVQEVFLDMWEKREEIIIQHSLFNYLYTTTRNRTLRFIKANSISPESLDLFRELFDEYSLPAALPEEHTDSRLRSIDNSVITEIADLPEQMKKVYLLNIEEGMSVTAIAEQLQIAPQTVRNHLAKVRKRLNAVVSRMTSLFFSLL